MPLPRRIALLLAPLPIVAASFGISRWLRSDAEPPLAMNDVLVRQTDAGEAQLVSYLAEENNAADEKLAAACAARGNKIQEQLGDKCETIVRSPFVVSGDMTEKELVGWHERTIQPAATAMGHRYFKTKPNHPITVLLFTSKESYDHYADKLYRDKDISIYGYYKPRERTLVMNIATGGGTLVHELTHALVAFDCPQVPPWFNEGLASLHEQCRFREDENGPWVEGLVNWRLPRLQKELEAERVPSLADFIKDPDFRGEREAVNYAQARYFCLYMQRQGVLEKYYAALKKNIKDDPHGALAVKEVFPDLTWEELDADFQQFTRDLKR